ncbi:MAG TPA: ferrochelatase [Burkholderiales bacterium]|jgi:ferrochelatase|nr:ferrochelatase [Burkholderiales bacterium]
MSVFRASPPYHHGTPAKTGVLLVNLGTPEAPTAQAVKPYLREFLSDPAVVELPRLIWQPLLHLFVLTTRPRRTAEKYAEIWMADGSPLKVHTERQTKLLRGYLGERIRTPLAVEYAMRYGMPAIGEKLDALIAHGCDRILIVPLYPQYAASTVGSTCTAVFRHAATLRRMPALRTITHFHDHPGYIAALAQSVREHWSRNGRPDLLLMSFHGVPRYTLTKGDPYHCECQKTARLLARELNLPEHAYRVCFQSRFGRTEWLKPYTSATLVQLGREQTGRVDVICPGFVSDCLETLEEIAITNKAAFLNAGGGEFHFIPCLNQRDDWMRALSDIVFDNLLGWPAGTPDATEAETARRRALEMGAQD